MTPFLYSFLGIFVAMDIIGVVPLCLGMMSRLVPKERLRIVNQSVIVAGGVALIFVVMGKWIFKLLGISMPDFKIGGGIVLLVMSILELIGRKKLSDHTTSTGVVPLAVPLITGPALLTAVMLQSTLYGYGIVLLSMAANFGFAWLALRSSGLVIRMIGAEGADVVSKISALFMTAIAFSLIRTGIFEAIGAAQIH